MTSAAATNINYVISFFSHFSCMSICRLYLSLFSVAWGCYAKNRGSQLSVSASALKWQGEEAILKSTIYSYLKYLSFIHAKCDTILTTDIPQVCLLDNPSIALGTEEVKLLLPNFSVG